ncbi:hypothetical protein V6N13_128475 [Hibiscus sabdariffa]|uniref:Uncharacterized protein n=1 Tax=Hibiscus sabdariffa TaxID=183260 RepID=A0ABR2P0U3_9ROSI
MRKSRSSASSMHVDNMSHFRPFCYIRTKSQHKSLATEERQYVLQFPCVHVNLQNWRNSVLVIGCRRMVVDYFLEIGGVESRCRCLRDLQRVVRQSERRNRVKTTNEPRRIPITTRSLNPKNHVGFDSSVLTNAASYTDILRCRQH